MNTAHVRQVPVPGTSVRTGSTDPSIHDSERKANDGSNYGTKE